MPPLSIPVGAQGARGRSVPAGLFLLPKGGPTNNNNSSKSRSVIKFILAGHTRIPVPLGNLEKKKKSYRAKKQMLLHVFHATTKYDTALDSMT